MKALIVTQKDTTASLLEEACRAFSCATARDCDQALNMMADGCPLFVIDHIAELEKKASLGQLIPGLAHELNNPLGFITSNLTVMVDYCRDLRRHINEQRQDESRNTGTGDIDFILSDLFDLLDESREGLERMKKLIHDLQVISRDDGHESPAGMDIHECLDGVLNVAWNVLKHKTVINKEYGRTPPVNARPGQVRQLFLHLLLHAVGTIEEKGEMTVTTANGDGQVTITIDIRGCAPSDRFLTTKDGIPSAAADTRQKTAKQLPAELLIARALAEEQNGLLEITPLGEDGTTYQVRLPAEKG